MAKSNFNLNTFKQKLSEADFQQCSEMLPSAQSLQNAVLVGIVECVLARSNASDSLAYYHLAEKVISLVLAKINNSTQELRAGSINGFFRPKDSRDYSREQLEQLKQEVAAHIKRSSPAPMAVESDLEEDVKPSSGDESDDELSYPVTSLDALQALTQHLDKLRGQAREDGQNSKKTSLALGQIKALADKGCPRAAWYYAELMGEFGTYKKAASHPDDSFYFPKKTTNNKAWAEHLAAVARQDYERALDEGEPGIVADMGFHFFAGKLFKVNRHLARNMLWMAFSEGDSRYAYELGQMCFHGQGGDVDYALALDALHAVTDAHPQYKEARYLLAEIALLKARLAKDEEQYQAQLSHAKALFEAVAVQGHPKAVLARRLLKKTRIVPGADKRLINMLRRLGQKTDYTDEELKALRNIALRADPEPQQQAKALLLGYYRDVRDGQSKLITTLAYLSIRFPGEDSPKFTLYYELLCELEPSFRGRGVNYRQLCRETEEKEGQIYDEAISSGSDDEAEENYQHADNHTTRDHADAEELVGKVNATLHKFLDELCSDKAIKPSTVESVQKRIQRELTKAVKSYSPVGRKTHSIQVQEDLATVNHYASQRKLREALAQVSTDFFVVQSRGIHSRPLHWGQSARREYRELVRRSSHPVVGLPVYSQAVYRDAQVEYSDISESSVLRLAQSSRFVSEKWRDLFDKPPYSKDELSQIFHDIMCKRKFSSRREQIQQLYTTNYSKFFEFIHWLRQEDSHFPEGNPFVSTGDIQSTHSARYAYGEKFYANTADQRLSPAYDAQGVPHRPYAGVLMISFHPLDDYADVSGHVHIPSKNLACDIQVPEHITTERECSFLASLSSERLVYIHNAKYPEFDKADYRPSYFLKYGLDEAAYKKFRQLLTKNDLHSPRHQLALALLGEYLSAYQTMFFLRYGYRALSKKDRVMLFRDRNGNYSFKPTFHMQASPSGDDMGNFLRRLSMRQKRGAGGSLGFFATPSKPSRTSGMSLSEQLAAYFSRPQGRELFGILNDTQIQRAAAGHGYTVVQVSGDGRCFFHAVKAQMQQSEIEPVPTVEQMTRRTIDYLLEHFSEFAGFTTGHEVEEIVDGLEQGRTWADHAVIVALARAYEVNVVLVRDDGAAPTIIKCHDDCSTLYLGYQVGRHYVSLQPAHDGEGLRQALAQSVQEADSLDLPSVPKRAKQTR